MKVFTVRSTPVKIFLRDLVNNRGMPIDDVDKVSTNVRALEKLAGRYNLQPPPEVTESNKAGFYEAVLSLWKSYKTRASRFTKSVGGGFVKS